MSVRAKFKCTNKVEGNITLWPVTGGSEENETFFQYTPSGVITLNVLNPSAADQFETGEEYYVDFTPAETDRQHAFENAPKEKQEITQDDVGSAEDVLGDFLKG